jgi:hypothetical protein
VFYKEGCARLLNNEEYPTRGKVMRYMCDRRMFNQEGFKKKEYVLICFIYFLHTLLILFKTFHCCRIIHNIPSYTNFGFN